MLDRLAYHYARAEQGAKAVDYLSRLAEKSVRSYANAEASRALAEALEHAVDLPEAGRDARVVDLVMRLVGSLYFQGRFAESLDLLRRHQARAEALGDARVAGEYHFWFAFAQTHADDSAGAARSAARAIDEARRADDRVTAGKAHYVLAREGFWLSRFAEGAEQAALAVAALQGTEAWWWLGHAHCFAAINLCSLGRFDTALEETARARGLGREREDPRLQSYGAWAAGRVHATRGDWERAIPALTESLRLSPDPLNTSYATGWLGFAHRERGDFAQAVTLLESAVAALTAFRYSRLAGIFRVLLSEAYLWGGREARAREAAESASLLCDELRFAWAGSLARRALGRIALAAGDLAAAERELGPAVERLEAMEAAFDAAVTRLDLAELRARLGDPAGSRAELELARARFAALGAPAYLERAERAAGRLAGSAA